MVQTVLKTQFLFELPLETRPLYLGAPFFEDVDQEDDHSGAVEDKVDPVDPLSPADKLPTSGSVASVHIDTLLQLLQLLVDQQQHLRLSRLGDGLHLHKQDAGQGCLTWTTRTSIGI